MVITLGPRLVTCSGRELYGRKGTKALGVPKKGACCFDEKQPSWLRTKNKSARRKIENPPFQ